MSSMSTKDVQKVTKELMTLHKKPLEGISVDEVTDVSKITASIEGPIETPFENGVFHVILELGDDFPNKPPTGKFLTKIFHPNVSKTGEICVNTLKKDWESTLGISHVLQVIRCLLIAPNPESALNEDAGRLFQEDYEKYASKAKMLTGIHAKPKKEKEDENSDQNSKKELALEKTVTDKPTTSNVAPKKKKTLKRL